MKRVIKTFCLAHKPVLYNLPSDAVVIWAGDGTPSALKPHRLYRVGDVSPELEAWHPFLAGCAGAFAAAQLLSSKVISWEPGECINITQYRKFVYPNALGHPTNFPGASAIKNEDAKYIDWVFLYENIKEPFLLPQELNFSQYKQNLFLQYASCHHISDLMRYLAIAVEVGALNSKEVWDLQSSFIFSPGGTEFGLMPVDLFIHCAGILRKVSELFVKRHLPQSPHVGQRRAVAFCNERLGSFLINRYIKNYYSGLVPDEIRGVMHVVTDDGVYRGG